MGLTSRVIAWLLFLCSTAFGSISLITAIQAIREALTWKPTEAIVSELIVHPIARNKFGVIEVHFRYSTGSTEEFAVAETSGLPFGAGESLARRYRIGSRHRIRIDPGDSTSAEIDVGWNIQFLFVPITAGVISVLLLLGGRYYLRLGRTDKPLTTGTMKKA